MSVNQQNWANWLHVFNRWGISEGVATALENSGSLSMLAAQLLYICQPLLAGMVCASTWQAFTDVLENPVEKKAFISFLREAQASGTGG